jgi:hypothetical protein
MTPGRRPYLWFVAAGGPAAGAGVPAERSEESPKGLARPRSDAGTPAAGRRLELT